MATLSERAPETIPEVPIEVDKLFEEFKKIPGWDRFPLPEVMYKTYNIPKPKPYDGLRDFLTDHENILLLPGDGPVETRQADGVQREVGSLPIPEIEVEVKPLAITNQSDGEHPQQTHVTWADSTEPTEPKIQESESQTSPSPHEPHDA